MKAILCLLVVMVLLLPVSEAVCKHDGTPSKDNSICCGTKEFRIRRNRICCGKRYVPTKKRECCHGWSRAKGNYIYRAYKIDQQNKECCGPRYIKKSNYICCDGKVHHKRRPCPAPSCGIPSKTLSTPISQPLPRSVPRSNISTIINGEDTTIEQHPWQIFLETCGESGCFVCGGSILSERWVLTATHCTDNMTDIIVYAGNAIKYSGQQFRVKRKVEYFPYFPLHIGLTKVFHDIALLEIDGKFDLDSDVTRAICLPDLDENFDGENCAISGWGRTSPQGPASNILQAATVPIVNIQTCYDAQFSHEYSSLLDTHLCRGYPTGEVNTCSGDSGGPLACQRSDGSWVLAGVTSFGLQCSWYGFSTRVSKYVDWIKETIAT